MPFLLSAVLVVVGLVRVDMEETPIFRMAQERNAVVKAPVVEVFQELVQVLRRPRSMAVTYTLFATAGHLIAGSGTKPWSVRAAAASGSPTRYLLMLMVAVCVFALFIVLSCVYADRIGRRRVLTFAVALVVFAVAFPYLG